MGCLVELLVGIFCLVGAFWGEIEILLYTLLMLGVLSVAVAAVASLIGYLVNALKSRGNR